MSTFTNILKYTLLIFVLLYSANMYAFQLDTTWTLSDYVYATKYVETQTTALTPYKKLKYATLSATAPNDVFLSPIWKNSISGAELAIDNKIILYGVSDLQSVIDNYNLQTNIISIEEIEGEPVIYVLSLKGIDYEQIENLCVDIVNSGYCEIAEPNMVYLTDNADIIPSQNPLYSNQWQWNNTTDSRFDVNAEEAWQLSTGKNITVAIIDNGFELNHPDLKENFLEGYDCTNGRDGAKKGAYKITEDSHGTQCAGMIGAENNNIGIIGIAPDCRMIPIRSRYSVKEVSADGAEEIKSVGSSTYTIKAFRTAYRNGADVISNSWSMHGVTESTLYDAVINEAITKGRNGLGCVVVFSTGNQSASAINYPANHPGTIAVGATTKYGKRADFSNYGDYLDIVAPGQNVYTTHIIPLNSYTVTSGTSFACPLVAGVAALILSLAPQLRWEEVGAIMKRTAYKLPAYKFYTLTSYSTWDKEVGYGLIDAFAAVKETQKRYVQNTTFSSATTETIQGTTIQVGNKVTDSKEYGDVVLHPNSKVVMQATDAVRLTNGFHAKAGSTFVAQIISGYDWITLNNTYFQSSPVYNKANARTLLKTDTSNEAENIDNVIDSQEISTLKIYSVGGYLLYVLSDNDIHSIPKLPMGYYILVATLNNGNVITQKIHNL